MTDATPEPRTPEPGTPEPVTPGPGTPGRGTSDESVARAPELLQPPLVTISVLALSGLLTVTALAGSAMVALTVALAAGVIAWGWSGLLGLPSPRGTAFVLAVGSTAAILTALASQDHPFLAWMPAALAGAMIAAFLHQLARRDGRPRLVESVASTVTAIAIVVSGATFVVLPRTPDGVLVLALATSAVAVSALTDLAGASQRIQAWLLPLAMLGGGVVALALDQVLGVVGWGAAAFLGGLSGGISHAVRRVLGGLPTISGTRSQLVSACASVLTGGVVVYVVGQVLVT